jgi:hypothetical protein
MTRPCVCGGSNENCRYCSGRGEISNRLANALTVHTHLPESKKVHIGGNKRPVNQISFTPSGLQKMKALIGELRRPFSLAVRRTVPPPVAPAAPSTSQLVPCPRHCGALLEGRAAVGRHLRQAHPSAPSKQQPKVSRSGKSMDGCELCPICKGDVWVKSGRLKRHMRKVHKRRFRQSVTGPAASSTSEKERGGTTFVAPRDKNLDATKPYAHSYRERGRFGSHPSHDGFDDESGPE